MGIIVGSLEVGMCPSSLLATEASAGHPQAGSKAAHRWEKVARAPPKPVPGKTHGGDDARQQLGEVILFKARS